MSSGTALSEAIEPLTTEMAFNLVITTIETRQDLTWLRKFSMLIFLFLDLAMAMLAIEE
jgi:hypothetical protein